MTVSSSATSSAPSNTLPTAGDHGHEGEEQMPRAGEERRGEETARRDRNKQVDNKTGRNGERGRGRGAREGGKDNCTEDFAPCQTRARSRRHGVLCLTEEAAVG
eukprot:767218-Hanusia_phi.AAC.6